MQAVDFSFDADKITPEWCRAQLAGGYRLAIACLWTGRYGMPGAEQALRYWREAGGLTAGYCVVHNGRLATEHLAQAQQSAGDEWERLGFVAIDIEVSPVTTSTVLTAAASLTAAGLRPVVYTSVSMWGSLCEDAPDCAHLPLWDASYGQTPSLEMRPPYGGWQRRTGHQYEGTTVLGEIQVDLSLFDDAFVLGSSGNGTATPERARDWQTCIDVVRGFSNEFAAPGALTLAEALARMGAASRQLADVSVILERLRSQTP